MRVGRRAVNRCAAALHFSGNVASGGETGNPGLDSGRGGGEGRGGTNLHA